MQLYVIIYYYRDAYKNIPLKGVLIVTASSLVQVDKWKTVSELRNDSSVPDLHTRIYQITPYLKNSMIFTYMSHGLTGLHVNCCRKVKWTIYWPIGAQEFTDQMGSVWPRLELTVGLCAVLISSVLRPQSLPQRTASILAAGLIWCRPKHSASLNGGLRWSRQKHFFEKTVTLITGPTIWELFDTFFFLSSSHFLLKLLICLKGGNAWASPLLQRRCV